MSSPLLVFLTCFGLAVAGALLVGEPHADAAGVSSGGFVSVTSARLLDTRVGTGAPAHLVAANSTLALQVTGRAGVPTTGVSAVVLNVTVTSPAKAGSITAYPHGSPRPLTSNLNFAAGQTVPNLVIVGVGTDGAVDLHNASAGTVNLIADITGYFLGGTVSTPGAFTPMTGSRLLDTRVGTGAPAHPVAANSTLALQVTGRAGVPTTGVSAVVLNVTVTSPAKAGSITAYPHGSPRPLTSNLNFAAGQTVPNLVIVRVGAGGAVDLHNASVGTVHLVADISGYFQGGTASTPGAFTPMTGSRLLDTRVGTGASAHPVAANSTLALQVTGRGGVPTTGVSAVVLNVTVTSPATAGVISAYPDASALPSTSNLNFAAGQSVPNLVIVPVGAKGAVDLHNASGGTVHLVADVTGYFQGLAGDLSDSPGRSLQGDIGHSGVLTGIGLSPPLIPAWVTGGMYHPTQAVLGAGAVYVLRADSPTTPPKIMALRESDGSAVWGPLEVGAGGVGLTYDAGRVFAVDGDCHLHAYDATSGTPQWTSRYVNDDCNSAPTAANGIVYFGTTSQLVAVSESTGSILWIAHASADSSPPGVVDGKVIVDPGVLLVSAFDAATGAPAWHYPGFGSGGGGRLVAIAGGRVYARSTSNRMTMIFDAHTGMELGTIASDGPTAVDAQNHVIITQKQPGGFDGCGLNPCSLVARTLDTGAALWSFSGDGSLTGPPLIVDGVVYVASYTGNIFGLDEMTGALVWSTSVHDYVQPFNEGGGSTVALNAADGLLIVSSGDGVLAFKTSSSADVAPIQHFYSGMVQGTCSETPGPFTVPSCTWNTTQTYAGVDFMHLIFDPVYKATLSVDFLDSAGNTLATVTTQSGDAYLTTPSLPAGGTYQIRVRGPATPTAFFKLYFAEAQPHIGDGPTASFSATALPFDPLPVGSQLSKSLIIRNTGDQNLNIGNTTLVGPGAAAFSIDFNSCDGADLPAGWPCTLVISAHPGTPTSSTAELTVPYGASSQDINLSVTGYGRVINMSPSTEEPSTSATDHALLPFSTGGTFTGGPQ